MAVCTFCKSTLVREDDALRRIGQSAELFDDHSPLALGTRGRPAPSRVSGRRGSASNSPKLRPLPLRQQQVVQLTRCGGLHLRPICAEQHNDSTPEHDTALH